MTGGIEWRGIAIISNALQVEAAARPAAQRVASSQVASSADRIWRTLILGGPQLAAEFLRLGIETPRL